MRSQQPLTLSETGRIAKIACKELEKEARIGNAIQGAGDVRPGAVADCLRHDGEILQLVVAGVRVAGIVGRRVVAVQVDAELTIGEDGIGEDADPAAGQEVDSLAVEGDDISGAALDAADEAVNRTGAAGADEEIGGEGDAVGGVAQRASAVGFGADAVALDAVSAVGAG